MSKPSEKILSAYALARTINAIYGLTVEHFQNENKTYGLRVINLDKVEFADKGDATAVASMLNNILQETVKTIAEANEEKLSKLLT